MAINRIKDSVTPFELRSKLQAIEDQLDTKPVDPQTRTRLFRQLESLQHDHIRISGLFSRTASGSFVEDTGEKIVSLFGKVVDKGVDYEVAEIAQESAELEHSLDTAPPLLTSDRMIRIQTKINSLRDRHCLSRKNLQIIAKAEHSLHKAEDSIHKREKPPIRHFDWLASQKPRLQIEQLEDFEDLFPPEIEEVFDLAGFVYNADKRMTRLKYHELPDDLKRKFLKHMEELGKEPFEDDMATIQALFAVANELAQNGLTGYPTIEDIHDFFAEREQIAREDQPMTDTWPASFR
jgi:hypothetical protein